LRQISSFEKVGADKLKISNVTLQKFKTMSQKRTKEMLSGESNFYLSDKKYKPNFDKIRKNLLSVCIGKNDYKKYEVIKIDKLCQEDAKK
jgi:hypothetical protein